MAKKQDRSPAGTQRGRPGSGLDSRRESALRRFSLPLFLLLSLLIYGNTISHDYALDDRIVVTENQFTQQGLAGIPSILSTDTFVGFFGEERDLVAGGRYRPLSLATLAIEQEFLGGNPHVSHLINILLYALTVWLLYLALSGLFRSDPDHPAWLRLPLVTTLLFLVHPLHTEVVANIKGRDELLALMLCLAALVLHLRFLWSRNLIYLPLSSVAYFLALLSKESAIPFVLSFLLTCHFTSNARSRENLKIAGASLLPLIAYLVIRSLILDLPSSGSRQEILNNPFLWASPDERYATIFLTLGKYLQLLAFPHPLTHDYYYNQIPLTSWTDLRVLAALVLYLALGAVVLLLWARRHPISYGLLFFIATLSIASNLFFSIGVSMAERFLFIPSLGFLLAVCSMLLLGVRRALPRFRHSGMVWIMILAGISSVLSAKTIHRNLAWRDNFALFTTDIRTSSASAKLHAATGGVLLDAARNTPKRSEADSLANQAVHHLTKAVEIYPAYRTGWGLLGDAHSEGLGDQIEAIRCYERLIQLRPHDARGHRKLGVAAMKAGEFRKGITAYRSVLALLPSESNAWYGIGLAYEGLGRADSAMYAYGQALSLNPDYTDALGKLGTLHGRFRGDFRAAAHHLARAIETGGQDEWLFDNLGIVYASRGDYGAAIRTFFEGLEHYPRSSRLHRNLATTYGLMGDDARAQDHLKRARSLEQRGEAGREK